MRILLLLVFLGSQAFGQSHFSNRLRQHVSKNNTPYSPYQITTPVDAYNNTASFYRTPKVYYDGDYSAAYNPQFPVYYSYGGCETFIEMGGTYNVSNLKVYDKNTGSTFTIKSGNDIFSLVTDTVITLNTGLVRTVEMKKKNVKFLSYTISNGAGPSEVEIYSYPVSIDAVPPITLRPLVSLENMVGWNADEFTSTLIPYDSARIRQYEYNSKLVRKTGGNIFSFNPGYDQKLNFDQTYRDITAAGKVSTPLFFDALDYDSVWKPQYLAAGLPWTPRYKLVNPGQNPRVPASYAVLARLAYQYAARYGRVAVSSSNTRLEANNDHLTGLNLISEVEFGNEHDQWWDEDTNKFETPQMAYAKMTALWDGDEGRLGARHGLRTADPSFELIQSALADFNYGYNKIIHAYAKRYRTDQQFPASATNVHSYLTRDGGQHNFGDKGVAPEIYKRPGYKALGLEQYSLEHGDYELRYLPGKKRYYSEFGYDSNKESDTGVPMLTDSAARLAPVRFSTWEVQGSLLQRSFAALMKARTFDRAYVFTYFDYDFYGRGLPDYASDTRNPNNETNFYSQFGGAQQFAQSGIVLGQYAWALGTTTAPINILTAVGTDVTFRLPKDRAYYPFPTNTGGMQVRYAAEDHQGPDQSVWQDNKLIGTVTSQNDSVVVLHVTAAHTSYGGDYHDSVNFVVNNITQWRFDTPYASKTSRHMIDNMFSVMHDCKFLADSSKGIYRDYRFTNPSGKMVSMVWLPTQTWNQINNIQINVGSATAVTERKNSSRTAVNTNKTITGGKITTSINEMPKFFYWNTGAPNVSPLANAGVDRPVTTASTTIVGTGTDSDGSIASYSWSLISGGASTMSGTTTSTLSLSGLVNGSYTFRLTVTDNFGATGSDDVVLSVSGVGAGNITPSVTVADKTSITSTTTISSSAIDSDGSIASYFWTKLTGGTATLTNTTTATLSLSGLATGSYTFRCLVTDNGGATAFDDMTLTVTIAGSNVKPSAAYLGIVNATSSSIDLYDNGSTDSDGSIIGFRWEQVSGPNTATIFGANTTHATITGLVNGTYQFREIVTDNGGLTDTANCPVNISGVSTGNSSPSVVVTSKTVGTTSTTISASASDIDGSIASYLWTKLSGATVTLTNTTTATVSVSGLANGIYTFRCLVTDNLGASNFSDMTLTVSGISGGGSGGSTASQFVDFDFVSSIGPGGVSSPTLVYLPVGYGAAGVTFPVIVSLGGIGEKWNTGLTRAQNFNNIKNKVMFKYITSGHDIPFVVVMPMISFAEFDSYDGGTFQNGLFTNELAQYVVNNYNGDPQRLHLTGLSLGGQTICNSAIAYPNRWATCTVIGSYVQAYTLAGPVRAVFNVIMNSNDPEYLYGNPPYAHVAWVDELNSLGHIPFPSTYTVYNGGGHGGWNETYDLSAASRSLWVNSSVPNNTPFFNPYTWMLKYKIVGGVVSLY
jgi:hypothetical protein